MALENDFVPKFDVFAHETRGELAPPTPACYTGACHGSRLEDPCIGSRIRAWSMCATFQGLFPEKGVTFRL